MPGSSELSDALNPYYSAQDTSPSYDHHHVPSHYTNNSNSLQGELPEPSIPEVLDAQTTLAAHPRQPTADSVQLLKDLVETLVESITRYKLLVENEKKRRLAWEQGREATYKARITELETQVTSMQKEISTLKGKLTRVQNQQLEGTNSAGKAQHSQESLLDFEDTIPASSLSTQSEFVQGSSEAALVLRKRQRSGSPPHSNGEPPKLRVNRDGRVQTIHAAMRNHILKCMDLVTDRQLPPSHEEGRITLRTEPVRFVWEQTTKKSSNNARMKTRIIDDLKMNKSLYPLVPENEFSMAKLDSVFEQAFTTLRQKYAAQSSSGQAIAQDRGDIKAARARRLGRKKVKLANRVSTRKNLPDLTLPGFNAAFQLECMSSEESDFESDGGLNDEGQSTNSVSFLRIRLLSWRSSRLNRLYAQIDAREEQDRSLKPRRGIGRKDRRRGQPKDGNPLPPSGVAKWMVSKKWARESNAVNEHLSDILKERMKEDDGDDAFIRVLDALGGESDENEDVQHHQEEPLPFPQTQMEYNPMLVNQLPPEMTSSNYYAQQEQQSYMYATHTSWPNEYGNMLSYPSVLHHLPTDTYQQ